MAYPHNLRVTQPLTSTVDWGICDRCGFLYDLNALPYQYDVRGNSLQNLGIRVCSRTCYDEPADILRPVLISGPEGTVRNPRPNYYAQQMAGGAAPLTSPLMVGPEMIPDDGP